MPGTRENIQNLRLANEPSDNSTFDNLEGLESIQERFDDLSSGSEFVKFEPLSDPIDTKDGRIQRYAIITRGGYGYVGVSGIPRNQTSDLVAAGTTAWTTSDQGFYEHTIRNIMREGSPVAFVGAEGSYHNELVRPRQGVSLARSAAVVLRFCAETADLNPDTHHETDRHAFGDSRGGMVGMGLVSDLDQFFGQNVVSADLTAPCFPRRIRPGDIPEMLKQLKSEGHVVSGLLGKIAMNVFLHYPSTYDPHPIAVANQIAILPALLSGEAGDMARFISKDKVVHVTTFDDDFMSMRTEWEYIFQEIFGSNGNARIKGNSNVRITPIDGAHITIAHPETLAYTRARLKAAQVARERGNGHFTGPEVFDGAHEYVDAILFDVLKHRYAQRPKAA